MTSPFGLDRLHHDGSEAYVADPDPGPGDAVAVFLRAPRASGVRRVHLRSVVDGEPVLREAVVDREDDGAVWWRADLDVVNPVVPYRFLTDGGPYGHRWLNAMGETDADPTDAHDFRLTTFAPPPAWAAGTVFYQVFPDRFARSGERDEWPAWALPAGWDDQVITGGPDAMRQLYGGDLPGLQGRLDHVADLGAGAVYLNPFFPARSNHRYNASTFAAVDPVLGGDEALAALVAELHRRGMHLVGDFTPNHCGDDHPWFRAAQADASATEAGFFDFRRHPDDYRAWWGEPTLPELDYRSEELRRRVYGDPDSVIASWLRPPFGLDGWRIDVAHNVGRHGLVDLNREVATGIRAAMDRVDPGTLLIAEHGHDASLELMGDGWQGTMNYAGFATPAWAWLVDPASGSRLFGLDLPMRPLPGPVVAETMQRFRASVPWRATLHNWNLLGTHDTPRFRTVAGSSEAACAGAGLLLTMPGSPLVFAGDELGLEGPDHESARRPMPWDHPEVWDRRLHDTYRRLGRLRRDSRALRGGGFRWVGVDDDQLVYLREVPGERVLVRVARAPSAPMRVAKASLGAEAAAHLLGGDDLRPEGDAVVLPADGPAVDLWRLA